MKCPKTMSERFSYPCIREECAIWNEKYGCCDTVAQTKILELIHRELSAISVKEQIK